MSRRRRGFSVPVPLRESAAATVERTSIRETASFGEARKPTADGSVIDVQIIRAGWGSSGFYPAKVLERDGPQVFKAGTQMFMDHPTATDEAERPERSVRDLGAVLTEDAYTADDGKTLRAKARVFPTYRQFIAEAYADIGVSIRAQGTGQMGEAEGRSGLIIESLTRGESVDFVTRAGAGGKVLALLESARAELRETTTDVTRTALNDAIGERYAGRETYVWVRDFDPDAGTVWYDVAAGGDCDTWQQSYTITADAAPVVTLTGKPVQVVAQTVYAPVADPDNPGEQPGDDAIVESARPPAVVPVTESVTAGTPPAAPVPPNERSAAVTAPNQTGQAPAAAGTVVLGEAARLSELLAESRTNLAEANAARDKAEKRADKAEARATLVEAQRGAETKVREALVKSDLKEAAWGDVVARVCDSLTLTEAGKVDEAKLTTAIEAEIQAERTKVARLMEAYGVGSVTGLGSTGSGREELSEADFEKDMAEVFQNIGLTEADAKIAAKGRG